MLADPAAEWPAAALAFDMRFTAVSSQGDRVLAATDFFKGLYETALEPGEVLKSIHVRLSGANQRAAFGELTRRSGDYAIVGAFVNAGMTGGRLVAPGAAFFAVASQPLLAKGAMRALEGTRGDAAALTTARACLEADRLVPGGARHPGHKTRWRRGHREPCRAPPIIDQEIVVSALAQSNCGLRMAWAWPRFNTFDWHF